VANLKHYLLALALLLAWPSPSGRHVKRAAIPILLLLTRPRSGIMPEKNHGSSLGLSTGRVLGRQPHERPVSVELLKEYLQMGGDESLLSSAYRLQPLELISAACWSPIAQESVCFHLRANADAAKPNLSALIPPLWCSSPGVAIKRGGCSDMAPCSSDAVMPTHRAWHARVLST